MGFVTMKWFVMIFFLSYHADGTRDTFVFTNPTFDDRATCMATLTDRDEIAKYVMGLVDAYSGMIPGPIEMANCINQEQFDELERRRRIWENKHDT